MRRQSGHFQLIQSQHQCLTIHFHFNGFQRGPDEQAGEIASTSQWNRGSDTNPLPHKSAEMIRLHQRTIIPWRRDFQYILPGNQIIDVQHPADLLTHLLAILKPNPFGPIDVETHPLPPTLPVFDTDQFIAHGVQHGRQEAFQALAQRT